MCRLQNTFVVSSEDLYCGSKSRWKITCTCSTSLFSPDQKWAKLSVNQFLARYKLPLSCYWNGRTSFKTVSNSTKVKPGREWTLSLRSKTSHNSWFVKLKILLQRKCKERKSEKKKARTHINIRGRKQTERSLKCCTKSWQEQDTLQYQASTLKCLWTTFDKKQKASVQ